MALSSTDIDYSRDLNTYGKTARARHRPIRSCLTCHWAKRKCDRGRPCQRCKRLGAAIPCCYEADIEDDEVKHSTTSQDLDKHTVGPDRQRQTRRRDRGQVAVDWMMSQKSKSRTTQTRRQSLRSARYREETDQRSAAVLEPKTSKSPERSVTTISETHPQPTESFENAVEQKEPSPEVPQTTTAEQELYYYNDYDQAASFVPQWYYTEPLVFENPMYDVDDLSYHRQRALSSSDFISHENNGAKYNAYTYPFKVLDNPMVAIPITEWNPPGMPPPLDFRNISPTTSASDLSPVTPSSAYHSASFFGRGDSTLSDVIYARTHDLSGNSFAGQSC